MHARKLALAIIAAGVGTQAMAGGFALNEQSVSAGGSANAGRASNVLDASVVYNNPAAMVKLKQAQFTQALAFIDMIGLWPETMTTLSMVVTAVFFCTIIGIPIGIWAAHSPRVAHVTSGVCDTLQTFPSFIYLIPVIMLLQKGLSRTPWIVLDKDHIGQGLGEIHGLSI